MVRFYILKHHHMFSARTHTYIYIDIYTYIIYIYEHTHIHIFNQCFLSHITLTTQPKQFSHQPNRINYFLFGWFQFQKYQFGLARFLFVGRLI